MASERPHQDGAQELLKRCAQHALLTRLGDKWAVLVLYALATAPDRRLRFSAIRNGIDGITQRMLTLTLRDLERDGLVTRHIFAQVPPRVEYELTEMGGGMLQSLQGFANWIRANWPRVENARHAFDAARRARPDHP